MTTTSKSFYYSTLRYCDIINEEVLVIGVLLLFPASRELRFIHPKRLDRLKAAFPNYPEETIRGYFEGFKTRAAQLQAQQEALLPNSATEARTFIAEHFLTEDSSALQFSVPRAVVTYTDDLDKITLNYYDRYLKTYEAALAEAI